MESLLKDVGECGLFQVIAINIVHLCKLQLAFSNVFTSYGIYNPGWQCADVSIGNINASNVGSTAINESWPRNNTTSHHFQYDEKSCRVHGSCDDVQFNPESSTLITEWELICDRSWVGSFIISIQMAGTLVGSFFTGYAGDRFGRKYTLLFCLFVNTVLNIIVIFSVSWEMFAVCRFFIGVMVAFVRFLPFVYSSEFVSPKWRGPIACHPVYATGAILLAVVCMVTKNWVHVHIVIIAVSALTFMAVLWVPRSLRWLVVHDKEKETYQVCARIAKMNGKDIPDQKSIETLVRNFSNQSADTKKYRMIDLFRKGFRMSAFIIAFLFLTVNLSYFAISFGVKSLPGNIYTNLIMMYSSEYIANIYTAVTGNRFGRRASLIISLIGSTACLLSVAAIDRLASGDPKDLIIFILAMSVTVFNNVTWYVLTAYMAELYPTVIRSTVTGWGSVNAQIGAIIAPYLIPNKPDYLYICYLIMGCMNVVSCLLFFFLEDTTKKALADTWSTGDQTKGESKDLDNVSPDSETNIKLLEVKKVMNNKTESI